MTRWIATALAIACLADAERLCGPLNVLGGSAEVQRVGNCLYSKQTQITNPKCRIDIKQWKPEKKK